MTERFTLLGHPITELPLLGSPTADLLRLQSLRDSTTIASMLRSPSTLVSPLTAQADDSVRWAIIAPQIGFVANTGLPHSLNSGPLWIGKGLNVHASAGIQVEWSRIRLIFAPQLLRSANDSFPPPDTGTPLAFQQAPPVPPDRNPYSAPWYIRPHSIDLPLRFGEDPLVRLDAGQSSLTVDVGGGVEVGFATENAWWGPGIRNALVLSNNAGGFPHLLVRSRQPWRTPIGAVELRYMLGSLSESAYFDFDSSNNRRSFSGLAVSLRPAGVDGLTIGATRVVYAPVGGWTEVLGRLFDVFANTGRPNDVPSADLSQTPGKDQLISVFSRWAFPSAGAEAYAELSRSELPANLRDFLQFPNHTLGYVIGLQWSRPMSPDSHQFRIQAELASTEQSPTFRNRPIGTYYTSRRVIQGYTHRGRVIGASVGPGGSGQWLAADYVTPEWSAGLFFDRKRWNEDAHALRPWLPYQGSCEHDVSLRGGVRGWIRQAWGQLSATVASGERLNVYFDNGGFCPNAPNPRDVSDVTVSLSYTPFTGPR